MDSTSKNYLEKYLSSLSPKERNQYHKFDSYYFCADEENANICTELVLKGEKRVTASLLWGYEKMIFKDELARGDGTEYIVESIEFDVDIPDHMLTKAACQ
jgi:uncharacterized protein YhfF